jgi:hypothetical protein
VAQDYKICVCGTQYPVVAQNSKFKFSLNNRWRVCGTQYPVVLKNSKFEKKSLARVWYPVLSRVTEFKIKISLKNHWRAVPSTQSCYRIQNLNLLKKLLARVRYLVLSRVTEFKI